MTYYSGGDHCTWRNPYTLPARNSAIRTAALNLFVTHYGQQSLLKARRNGEGFALIGLVIGIVVLAVLATIVVLAVGGTTTTKAPSGAGTTTKIPSGLGTTNGASGGGTIKGASVVACNQTVETLESAIEAYKAQSPTGAYPATLAALTAKTTATPTNVKGPWLTQVPSARLTKNGYAIVYTGTATGKLTVKTKTTTLPGTTVTACKAA